MTAILVATIKLEIQSLVEDMPIRESRISIRGPKTEIGAERPKIEAGSVSGDAQHRFKDRIEVKAVQVQQHER